MTQIIFQNGNGVLSQGAISEESDLEPKVRILLNGCNSGGRCYVCGKHVSELKPFGGPGDPLVGDFKGELLVKRWRMDAPDDEEAEKAWEEAEKEVPEGEDPLSWFISKYGREKGEEFYHYSSPWVGASWECRDCIILDYDDYFKITSERYRSEREIENQNKE